MSIGGGNQDISEWNLNNVIHGLLLQPDVQISWSGLLADASTAIQRIEDLTWDISAAEDLIGRLELSREPAYDLAAAAIAGLAPGQVHLFPIPGSSWNAMDSIIGAGLSHFKG